jgi:glycosyltransferase involved in cell wall biosynthesis
VGGTVQDRTGWSLGIRPRLAAALDRAAVARSDLVLVDTEEHRVDVDAATAVVVPVGASNAWFAAATPPEAPVDRPLRVVFFGLFTPLQGTTTVARAIRQALAELPHGSLEVTMIGGGQDEAACRTMLAGYDAVTWRPWVDPRCLPQVVARADVCLGIFGRTPKAARVVPNKVYQGAAAGCAIVTADTQPQRRALGGAAVFVPPGDASALACVLVALARDRDRVCALRTAASRRARTAFAPAHVVETLVARLGDAAANG